MKIVQRYAIAAYVKDALGPYIKTEDHEEALNEAQAIIDAERAKNTELRRLLDGLAKAREGFGEDAIARDYQTFLDERERKDAIIDEAVGLLANWAASYYGDIENEPPTEETEDFIAKHGKEGA